MRGPAAALLPCALAAATWAPGCRGVRDPRGEAPPPAVLRAAEASPEHGHLEGTVVLSGPAPALPPLPSIQGSRDHAHCTSRVRDERLLLGPRGEVAGAVVALTGAGLGAPQAEPRVHELRTAGCAFVPRVLAMAVGSTLRIQAEDAVLHNPRAAGVLAFSRLVAPDAPLDVRARDEGLATFQCDFHPWMKAEVHVLPHEFFDVTGADGSFKILNLPPGTYTVEVRHEVLAPFFVPKKPVQTVTVEKGKTTKLGFEVEAPKL